MAIYDCFTFFNEIELLEWRLKLLDEVVDYFVIVESNMTHQYKPKEYIFLKEQYRFKKYLKKIRYIQVDGNECNKSESKGKYDWKLENYQRNCIIRGLYDCKEDDIIIIADIYEFINPYILKNLFNNNLTFHHIANTTEYRSKKSRIRQFFRWFNHPTLIFNQYINKNVLYKTPLVCEQEMYYFFINYKRKDNLCASIITMYKHLKEPNALRTLRNVLPSIDNAGWHLSYMGGIERIKQKIDSIVEGVESEFAGNVSSEKMNMMNDFVNKGIVFWSNEQLEILDREQLNIKYISWFIEKYPYMYNKNEKGE